VKFVFEKGCEQLIVGSGQMGNVTLSPEAEAYFSKKGCKVILQPTPEAIGIFNRSQRPGFFTLRAEFPMKAEAALEVHVESEPGDLGVKPKRFRLNGRDVEIVENLDQWQGPDYRYFKVKGDDGNLYILHFDEGRAAWELTMFQPASGNLRSRALS
jgi:hypothetical protein